MNNVEDYTSKDYRDIVEFYNTFETKQDIITWMQNRKKAKPNIVEYNKDKDNYAIVVIPTIDTDGEWAKKDKEIFKGLHIIFAENEGKKPNEYFNYSYSVNQGVERALKYNLEWVIISNDDMIKEDDISKLIAELKQSEEYDTLFFPKTNTYSSEVGLYKPVCQNIIRLRSKWRRVYMQIYKRLNIKYELLDVKRWGFIYKNLIYKSVGIRINHHQGNFIVLNAKFIKQTLKGKVFDDTFINGHEDSWLSYKYLQHSNFKMSDFRIKAITGGTLGTGIDRAFREIANEVYFEDKINSIILQ